MPKYITGLADFGSPPYGFKNLTSATFILDADESVLQKICDDFLNAPLGRTATDELFVSSGAQRVLMCCSTFPIAEAAPLPPLGYSAYSEITLLFSVFDRENQQWGWYVPVLFIDGPPPQNTEEWQAELPIAVGREMYGLPKTRGEIALDAFDHTGKVAPIAPNTTGYKVDIFDAIDIKIGACATLTIDDELAAQETALLGLVIAERQAREKRARRGKITNLRRRIAALRKRVGGLRRKRDRIRAARREAVRDLTRLHERPGERTPLTPHQLVEMIWGPGDPYIRVGAHPVEDADWLRGLGFIARPHRRVARQGRRKKKARSVLMAIDGPMDTLESEPDSGYDFEFNLLGLRQLHDPVPGHFGDATIQQVVRTQLLFDRLPWSPLQTYCVKIEDPLSMTLGIGPLQSLAADRVFVLKNAGATFGAAATIVV